MRFVPLLGIVALILGLYALYGAGSGISFNLNLNSSPAGGGVSNVTQSQSVHAPRYALSVLFIGNSYTFVNDVPGQLVNIASSDPTNNTQLTVQSVTKGGIGLKELWEEGTPLRVLNSRQWDYVVLQEQSFWAMFSSSVSEATHYAKLFDTAIRHSGSQPLLYLTWIRKPDTNWYVDKSTRFLRSPDHMFKRLAVRTDELAEKIEARVVPVGVYWLQALQDAPEIELYQTDGSHPSAAGSYLAALSFYKTLTRRPPTGVTWHPPEVPAEDAAKLRAIVAQ